MRGRSACAFVLRPRAARAAPAALALALLFAGCSSGPPNSRSVSIPPNEFHELNLQMTEGGVVRWSWTVGLGFPVTFNVHSHTSGVLRYHHETEGGTDTGTFTAPADGLYSLLWENLNSDEPVHLTFDVTGDFTLVE